MRILYVTADLPWPLTSGYLRHYHFIRALFTELLEALPDPRLRDYVAEHFDRGRNAARLEGIPEHAARRGVPRAGA